MSVITSSLGRGARWSEAVAVETSARDKTLIVSAVLCSAFLLTQLLDYGYGRDQGIFAVVGRVIREGGVPYRDAWDFKPPGIYFIYTLAGSARWGIRALEVAALLSLAVAFAKLSTRYLGDGRPGILGATLAILTYVQLEFWHTAQPESFGAAIVAWGMVCAAGAPDDARTRPTPGVWWRWLTSGVCYGCAALLKPTIGAAGAASLIAASPQRGASRAVWTFALGISLPIASCVILFLARGGLAELTDALGDFAPRYASLAWQQSDVVSLLAGLLRGWLVGYSLINVVGLLFLFVPFPTGAAREGLAHIGLAIAILLAGILAQGRLFPYHFGTVLPLTSLLAGWGYWRLWLLVRARWSGMLAFAVLIVALASLRSATTDLPETFAERCLLRLRAWTHPAERQAIRDRLYSVADYHAADNRAAAEWLARETSADAAVFVYGFTPEIYVSAHRRPASRYIYDVPQRAPWSRARARADLLADLNVTPPEVILVEHLDVMPWVLGTTTDSAQDVEGFPGLRDLLGSRYARTTSIGKFDVHRRTR